MKTLEQAIRTSLPDLMELGVGCVFARGVRNYKVLSQFVEMNNSKRVRYVTEELDAYEKYSTSSFVEGSYFFQTITIIGKPITLPDVLRWLKQIYPINSNYWAQRFKLLELWDLTIPNLSDQPQPVKDLLFNLIPKE